MRYLLRVVLLVAILGITNVVFSEEPIDTFDKIKGEEQQERVFGICAF